MSYVKKPKFASSETPLDHTREVTGSNPVSPSVVSYAEFNTYEYLPCGSAAVTLIKKAVVLLFLKGA
jgi:hypothetical protein